MRVPLGGAFLLNLDVGRALLTNFFFFAVTFFMDQQKLKAFILNGRTRGTWSGQKKDHDESNKHVSACLCNVVSQR